MAVPFVTALRKAIMTALLADGELLGLLGGPSVYHRFVRKLAIVPSVTYYDIADHPHPRMPILASTVVVDVWAKSLDSAELIAQRVIAVLDTYDAEDTTSTPFTVSTGELNWVAMNLSGQIDNIAGEAPEIIRKTLTFNLRAFEVAA
jgi:hypothetical protein